jgi:uncharacterized delta-60 repeat protein
MLPRAFRGVAAWMLAALIALIVAPAALADPSDLDASFATAGVTQFTPPDTWAEDLVRQPDGKLIVAGTQDQHDGTFGWAIARVNADGGVDTSFQGGDGVKVFLENGQSTGATAAAVEADGTVDVTGDARFGTPAAVRVLRFTDIGTTAGTAQVPIANATEVTGNGIAVQPDGKLVVAGTAHISGVDHIFVARFNADGSPDTTFDNEATPDGVLVVGDTTCDSAGAQCQGDSLGLVTDGGGAVTAIYMGGASQGADPGARIVRFTPTAGSFGLDTSYGSAGVLKIAAGTLTDALALLVQGDGKVVALGSASSNRCAATRRLADGTPDLGFGSAGAVTLNLAGDFCSIADAALLADGRIAFAGGNVTGTSEVQAVGRLTAAGQPDTTFANGGIVTRPIGSLSFAGGLVALADGGLLTAGGTGLPHHMFVARLTGGDGGSSSAPSVSLNIPSGGLVPRHDLTLTGSGDGSSDVTVDLYTRAPDATKTFLKTLTADRSGSSWTLSTTLPDGAYVAQAHQSNGTALGSSDEVTFFVDTQSPDLTIDRPANGGTVDDDGRPVFSGRAGAVQNDRATVTVLLSGPQGAGGEQNVQRSGGGWSLRWPTVLPPGHYTATAIQSDQLNNTTSRTIGFDISLASKLPFAVDSLVPTQQVRHVPQVAGTSIAAARKALASQLVYVDVDYDFGRGKEDNCSDKDVGLVRQQSPAAGDVVNSVENPTKIRLKVCVSGDDDVAKTCDLSQLRDDLKRLKLGADDFEVVGAFLTEGKRCQDTYDVRIKKTSNDDAQPKLAKVTTVNRPGKRRDQVKSVVDCPRDPEAQDLRVYVSDGTPATNKEYYGFKANGSEGWTLPADHDSAFNILVTDRAGNPVDADVFVDPSAVVAPAFTKTLSHTDSAGAQTYRIHPGRPGTIDLCVVNDQGPGPALFGTAQLKVVDGPKVGEIYNTTNGRRLILKDGFTHPAFANAANVFDDVFGFIKNLFGGKSKTVNAAAASKQKSSDKLDTIHDKAQVTPAQVNTCGGALDDRPKPPVIKNGPLFGQVDNSVYSGTGPVVAPDVAGDCGPALVGIQQLSAAEGRAAGLITNDGGSLITNDGGSAIAEGAGNIVASGAGNIVASGAGNIVASGAGNIVASGAGNIVASGAGNLNPAVAQIVASGAGNIVASGAGNIVASGAGSFLP